MIPDNGVTVIDPTMKKNEIRIIYSMWEIFGFKIINETGKHLYIECKPSTQNIKELVIRQ